MDTAHEYIQRGWPIPAAIPIRRIAAGMRPNLHIGLAAMPPCRIVL